MPKIQVYEPPKYPKPPGFEESTGVFEANEDGISVLDMTGSRSGWMGSTSMFGSQMTGLNSRTDLRKAFEYFKNCYLGILPDRLFLKEKTKFLKSVTNSRFSIASVSRNSRRTISGRY